MKLCPHCAEPYADDAGFCPFDGAELARSVDPYLGRTLLARYRLVRCVGSGGMAVVYLARHVLIERLSAIKILRRDLGMNASHRERFLREARAVNRINHPNIVEITDFGEDGGLVFLVMEYVEGQSLLAALDGGALGFLRATRVAMQVASALGRAHELGVIHRDLKPENVLIVPREAGEYVKLTDFGIAKIVDAPSLTFSEQRFGTPGYIAPEYVEGGESNALGDIYALGVVLYEMITGTLPFDARFPIDRLVLPLTQDPVRPSARTLGVPPALEDLVLRMLARRPDDRPQDAYAVHDALERVERDLRDAVSGGSLATGAINGEAAPMALSSRSWLAAEIEMRPAGELAERWHATLASLVVLIDRARGVRGAGAPSVRQAQSIAEIAATLVASLDRAKAAVADHQARVDGLDATGRAFRASLGRAIDVLSRDRSRERARIDALGMRSTRAAGESAIDADLGFQIETLQRRLDRQNEEMEKETADATGGLEGALAALRRITGELVRTMAEAASAIA
ncbi:MAG: serine/threonine-protein kinase [Polyangiaceae bacterium]